MIVWKNLYMNFYNGIWLYFFFIVLIKVFFYVIDIYLCCKLGMMCENYFIFFIFEIY